MKPRSHHLAALILGLGLALAAVVVWPGCSSTPEETATVDDAGEDGDAALDQDAEAGPVLQCWCTQIGELGEPSSQPGNGFTKCDAGWICGANAGGNAYWRCCPPLDEGIPNCVDDAPPQRPPATPHGLQCKGSPPGD
jgi:hypothetical protein